MERPTNFFGMLFATFAVFLRNIYGWFFISSRNQNNPKQQDSIEQSPQTLQLEQQPSISQHNEITIPISGGEQSETQTLTDTTPNTATPPPADAAEAQLNVRYGVYELQGRRKEMEDAHHAEVAYNDEKLVAIFGVYDGHGGKKAADFAASVLHQELKSHPNFFESTSEALKYSFEKTEKNFMEMAYKEQLEDGSTAVVAVILDKKLYVGNVGDSEAILCTDGKAIQLSVLHNPSKNPAEVQRVQEQGGRLYYNRVGHPVINPVLFNIAVSRAFGDIMYKHEEWTNGKKSGLTAEPDIVSIPLTPKDEFLILACDGLWDVFKYEEAVAFVKNKLQETQDPQEIATALVNEAIERETMDNVTACVVLFDWKK